MAINFLDSENKKTVLFSISDLEISFYDDIIKNFNLKYNDLFDIYNDFRLYQNHINSLIEIMETKKNNDNINRFYKFLLDIKKNNKGLIIIGN